ncbi:hypothetical protein PoHVEF18_008443 [Penicillium ochrochloron]
MSRLPTKFAKFGSPSSLLIDLLDPSETLVICCPSSRTADVAFGCYSIVPEYKLTEGCERLLPREDLGTSTKAVVVDQTTTEELLTITATHPIVASTTTFGAMAASELVGASVTPMLSLVRHQSDLHETGSGTTTPHTSCSYFQCGCEGCSNPT